MKKVLMAMVTVSMLMGSALFIRPALGLEGEVKMSVKELYSLSNRKSYRLGLRLGIISPTSDVLITKDSTYDFTFEFDAKLNENLDLGPRIGFASYKPKTAAYEATYGLMKFGFGGRLYLTYFGDYGSTHGFANIYVDGEADYYTASKGSEVTVGAPPSFAGFGAYGGAGVELAFGPNATGYVSAAYQKTSIKSSDDKELPLDGYVIQVGTRLAFI
jgi:hypothetical protein